MLLEGAVVEGAGDGAELCGDDVAGFGDFVDACGLSEDVVVSVHGSPGFHGLAGCG